MSLSEPWDFNTKTMLLNDLQQYQIYLASKSPRRKELLAGMGVDFEVMTTDVEETYDPSWSPEQIVMHLSRLKLSPIDMAEYDPKTLFIACDTIVVVGGRIIGKPKDETEARKMLHALSGNTHTVYSGLTVATPQESLTDYRATEVVFDELTDEMIQYYIDTYKPYDKAGSYGLQEWKRHGLADAVVVGDAGRGDEKVVTTCTSSPRTQNPARPTQTKIIGE